VGIAHDDQVAAVAGEGTEQVDLTGVGVLVLVDEHVVVLRAELVAVRVRLDDGAPDQVGVVGGGLVVEVVEVVGEEATRGDVLRPALALPEGDQVVALHPLLPRA
jgi:hypothetical protein